MSQDGSQNEDEGSQKAPEEEKGPEMPLTEEMLTSGLSLIRRTPNGASYAFSTLTLEEKEIDWLGDDLGNHKHLLNISLAKNAIPNIDCVQKMSGLLQLNASENKIASMGFMSEQAETLSYL
jgi:hypothetical protein